MVLKHEHGQSPRESLFKHRFLGFVPRVHNSVLWGEAHESAFLTRFLVILMLLVWGPDLEKYWYKLFPVCPFLKKPPLPPKKRELPAATRLHRT